MNKKLVVRIIILLLFSGMLAFVVFNDNGLIKFLRLRSEINKIDKEIDAAKQRLDLLEMEIDSLQTNKYKLERVAREKFHMAKPSEKTFLIEEK